MSQRTEQITFVLTDGRSATVTDLDVMNDRIWGCFVRVNGSTERVPGAEATELFAAQGIDWRRYL